MKRFVAKFRLWGLGVLALIVLLTPAMAAATGEIYYWQNSTKTTIIAQDGSLSAQTNLILDTTQKPETFTGQSNSCNLSVYVTPSDYKSTADQVNGDTSGSSSSCDLDSQITVYKDQSTAQQATSNVGTTSTDKLQCSAGNLGWIFCGLYKWMLQSIDWVEKTVIIPFLVITPVSASSNSPTFLIWSQFRNLANIFFIIAFLVAIFATTLSIKIDSYSLKKILPRLVMAAIFVQFSYILVALAIDVTNIIGAGLAQLMLSPLKGNMTLHLNAGFALGTSFLGIAGLIGGLLGLAGGVLSGTILFTVFAAFFSVIAVFFTLVTRQILITLILVTGPLAFAAWILPNTERFFKMWHTNLTRLLLMYPMIVLLFVSGKIFAVTAAASSGGGVGSDTIRQVVALVASVIPLFLVPFTFKFAGSALTSINGFITHATKGIKKGVESNERFEQAKTRTQQRRTELAAGEKINFLGARVGGGPKPVAFITRQTGRGLQPPTRATNVRSMIQFSKDTNTWKKRLEDENLTFEAVTYLARGEAWYNNEHADITTKMQTAQNNGNLAEYNVQRAALARLEDGKRFGRVYSGSMAARAAATLRRSEMEVLTPDEIPEIIDYTSYNNGLQSNKLIGDQLWGRAKEGMRKTNVHIAFMDLDGNLDKENLQKFVAKKTPGDWTNYSKDAIERLQQEGILQYMASSSVSTRATLINIMGTTGGPSIGSEQQEIIRQVLTQVPPPDPINHPDPPNL